MLIDAEPRTDKGRTPHVPRSGSDDGPAAGGCSRARATGRALASCRGSGRQQALRRLSQPRHSRAADAAATALPRRPHDDAHLWRRAGRSRFGPAHPLCRGRTTRPCGCSRRGLGIVPRAGQVQACASAEVLAGEDLGVSRTRSSLSMASSMSKENVDKARDVASEDEVADVAVLDLQTPAAAYSVAAQYDGPSGSPTKMRRVASTWSSRSAKHASRAKAPRRR